MKHKNRILFASVGGLGSLIVIAAVSFWSGSNYLSSNEWREHSAKVLATITRLESEIERSETAQRGYVLTANKRFLQPYARSIELARISSAALVELVRDDPVQATNARRIQTLLTNKIESLNAPINLIKSNQGRKAFELVKKGDGQELMEKLRKEFLSFTAAEEELLKERGARADRAFGLAIEFIGFGCLLAFALLFAMLYSLHKEFLQRVKTEHELRKAEAHSRTASKMKGQFLANMSHEMRTPLNGIIGLSTLLLETPLSLKQKEHMSILHHTSRHLLSIINQVLDLSKIESGKFQIEEQHFIFGNLLSSTVTILRTASQAKGLKIKTVADPDLPPYFIGDPLRLQQVLLNLLNNAIKFSEQGDITLKVSHTPIAQSLCRLNFSIKDEGIGMNEETLKRLFENFSQGDLSTTRRYGGTGLGLSISKHLVEMMNGQIEVFSEEGKGSEFRFYVEMKSSKMAIIPDALSDADQSFSLRGSVLVAEDNPTNQLVIEAMLKKLGLSCKLVGTGRLAIEELRRKSYDLVLMDAHMPDMDGFEATRLIRQGAVTEKDIPILAFTANAIREDLDEAFQVGMNDSIPKPVTLEDLRFKLAKWIPQNSSAVDTNVFEQYRDLEKQGSPGLLKELIGLFLNESASEIKALSEAIEARNGDAVKEVTHRYKSSCANIGAKQLAEYCRQLEKTSIEDVETLQSLHKNILSEYEKVERELDTHAAA